MIKILNESYQDVENFLKSNELIDIVKTTYPNYVNNPKSVEHEVNDLILQEISSQYDETIYPQEVRVVVIKISGDDIAIITSDHFVIEYNGFYYDFTAHQFKEEYNNLIKVGLIPVIQPIITSDRQITDSVSTVKSYALLEYK